MKNKLFLAFLFLSSLTLTGCGCHGGSDEPPVPDFDVTVNFYVDYNHQSSAEDIYFTCSVKNGEVITEKPTDPTESNYPEFPTFKGWSDKEIIDNYDDLWDFANDRVSSNYQTMRIYGIWMASGE